MLMKTTFYLTLRAFLLSVHPYKSINSQQPTQAGIPEHVQ